MYLFKKNVITDIIESVDDWIIFGTIQPNQRLKYEDLIKIWFKLIRSIEKKSGSVWILKLEGDNRVKSRHIHFLISSDGLSTHSVNCNLFRLKNKFSELKLDNYLLKQATINFKPYDEEQKGKFYMSKIELDVYFNPPNFFSYIDDGICVKWSSKLKHRYKKFNLARGPVF